MKSRPSLASGNAARPVGFGICARRCPLRTHRQPPGRARGRRASARAAQARAHQRIGRLIAPHNRRLLGVQVQHAHARRPNLRSWRRRSLSRPRHVPTGDGRRAAGASRGVGAAAPRSGTPCSRRGRRPRPPSYQSGPARICALSSQELQRARSCGGGGRDLWAEILPVRVGTHCARQQTHAARLHIDFPDHVVSHVQYDDAPSVCRMP